MRGIVLLLGGMVFEDVLEDPKRLLRVTEVVKRLQGELSFAVVTGGSDVARRYISAVSKVGGSKYMQDYAGILVTRLHALLTISALGEVAYPKVIESYEEAAVAAATRRVPVAGGIHPGYSTDTVAAIMAERLGFDTLVKMTGVDGVYEEDPRVNPSARRIEELSYDELERIVSGKPYDPGKYELLDVTSIKILRRSSIRTIILSADDPRALMSLLEGKRVGSLVR
ncbi:MAG: UMP kinase [Candidatus Korarchaeum sp.]|nr:UMP kinase [Candidatus Korarchaeum sp.]MDW8035615.1 UMP kinase [Candidatus Korarchaeum sp.]